MANGTDTLTVKEWLERIDRKLDDLTECTSELSTTAQLNKARISSHDGDLNRHENKLDRLEDKVDVINKKSNYWDGLNSALAVIGSAISAFIGTHR